MTLPSSDSCPACGATVDALPGRYCGRCAGDIEAVRSELVVGRGAALEIVDRLRHMANLMDPDEVSRTARTLNHAADVISREFGDGS